MCVCLHVRPSAHFPLFEGNQVQTHSVLFNLGLLLAMQQGVFVLGVSATPVWCVCVLWGGGWSGMIWEEADTFNVSACKLFINLFFLPASLISLSQHVIMKATALIFRLYFSRQLQHLKSNRQKSAPVSSSHSVRHFCPLAAACRSSQVLEHYTPHTYPPSSAPPPD